MPKEFQIDGFILRDPNGELVGIDSTTGGYPYNPSSYTGVEVFNEEEMKNYRTMFPNLLPEKVKFTFPPKLGHSLVIARKHQNSLELIGVVHIGSYNRNMTNHEIGQWLDQYSHEYAISRENLVGFYIPMLDVSSPKENLAR